MTAFNVVRFKISRAWKTPFSTLTETQPRARRLASCHTDIGPFRERAVASDEDPLRRLYNQIAGNVIRPREEQDDEDFLDVPPKPAVTDGNKH